MKQLIIILMIFFLNACQTHLPIISQMEDAEKIPCQKNIEQIELADIDYLLYANRMVDAMIQDHNVKNELSTNRIKLSIQPISYKNNSAKVDIAAVNTAIKNRIVRSAQFIIVNDKQLSDMQLSGVLKNKRIQSNSCEDNYGQFSMQLKHSRTGQMIWSDKKLFR